MVCDFHLCARIWVGDDLGRMQVLGQDFVSFVRQAMFQHEVGQERHNLWVVQIAMGQHTGGGATGAIVCEHGSVWSTARFDVGLDEVALSGREVEACFFSEVTFVVGVIVFVHFVLQLSRAGCEERILCVNLCVKTIPKCAKIEKIT